MQIICLQENLKYALNIVERIIGRNLTLPILNNLLLSAEKNKLKISSTNLEIGINCWVSSKVQAKGSITVPARLISEFVNNLPNKKIELKTKDGNLEIKCEKFKAVFKGLPADDFPLIPKIKNDPLIKIQGNHLRNAFSQVVEMSSMSESRPEISGIFMKFEDGSIRLAATDSFRLAEKTLRLDPNSLSKVSKEQSLIIPQRTIQELIRILSEKDGLADKQETEAEIVLSGGQALFDLGQTQVISRLIDGQYPDYQQIIPDKTQIQVVVNRQEIINNIKIASLFSGKINDVKISINPEKSLIEISSKDIDIGEHKSQIKTKIEGKAKVEIIFNYRYLLDGLNNILSDKVVLGLNDSASPVTVRPVGDTSYIYLVMPIKV
jgi:DNA polymerase III subunit beta